MKEIQTKTDRRVVKTKRAIRNAFAELLADKEMNQITIKDISELADINRKTFYSYYKDIYELVDDIENNMVSVFKEALVAVDFNRCLQEPQIILTQLTNIINQDIDFYGHIMNVPGNTGLVAKLTDAIKQWVKKPFIEQAYTDEETIDMMLDYTFSGMMTVYQKWFNSGRTISLDELSKRVSILIASGINGILADKQGRED